MEFMTCFILLECELSLQGIVLYVNYVSRGECDFLRSLVNVVLTRLRVGPRSSKTSDQIAAMARRLIIELVVQLFDSVCQSNTHTNPVGVVFDSECPCGD